MCSIYKVGVTLYSNEYSRLEIFTTFLPVMGLDKINNIKQHICSLTE